MTNDDKISTVRNLMKIGLKNMFNNFFNDPKPENHLALETFVVAHAYGNVPENRDKLIELYDNVPDRNDWAEWLASNAGWSAIEVFHALAEAGIVEDSKL
jgi:hypothetical protein